MNERKTRASRLLSETQCPEKAQEPARYHDGWLNFRLVLEEFAAWWRQYGEFLVKGEVYHEVAPQLIFMAFLTRIVNGGGFVDSEYGVGRGRIDVLVRKPYTSADGKRAVQREAVEIKVHRSQASSMPVLPPSWPVMT